MSQTFFRESGHRPPASRMSISYGDPRGQGLAEGPERRAGGLARLEAPRFWHPALGALLIAAGVSASAASLTNGVPMDLQGYIDGAIQAGQSRIVIPPGRYRVTPHDREHLVLRRLNQVEIVATGVELICTETTRALTIDRCTNLTVRGLTIDYDPLPFTQGRIVGLSADQRGQDIELFDGYPAAETARAFKYEIFRPDTRTLRGDDRYPQKVEVLAPRRLRITTGGGDGSEQVGDLIVIGAETAPHGSLPHAVECSSDVNLRLEDINLFAANCFGFFEHHCDGSTYLRCRIDRRAPADDPVPRGSPRLRSLDADAFHSKFARQGPAYRECVARFQGDDGVNICGDYHLITATQGREVRVLAKHTLNIAPGDEVELVSYDGERLPEAKAVQVVPAGTIRDEERQFLSEQRMVENLRTAAGALNQAFTITLDRPVTLPPGSLICSASRIGNGFAVKDCTFGGNRSRGILIKASHGEVSGNRIEGCRMSAILVAPEYWWLEAGCSGDLKITGNRISDCGGIPIWVEADAGNGGIAPAGAHRDLVIASNTVTGGTLPAILVCSTRGLRLEGNTLAATNTQGALPGVMRRAGLKTVSPVVQIHCEP